VENPVWISVVVWVVQVVVVVEPPVWIAEVSEDVVEFGIEGGH